MKKRKLQIIEMAAVGVAVLLSAGQSIAQVYTDDADLTVGTGSVLTEPADAVSVDTKSPASAFYLGEITLSGNLSSGATKPTPVNFSASTVCTDLRGEVYVGTSYNFSVQAYNGLLTGLNPHWGDDNAGTSFDQTSANNAIQNAADIFAKYSGSSTYKYGTITASRAQWWAAIQLAVWDVLYNTTGVNTIDSNGRFQMNTAVLDSTAVSLVNAWIAVEQNRTASYSGSILIPIVSGSSSTGWVPDGPPTANPGAQGMLYDVTAVPEPTTILAGALLLLPFGASTLRVLRRKM